MSTSPRLRVAGECARRGRAEVVSACAAILRGEEGDRSLLVALGGPGAPGVLRAGSRADAGAWARVWAARGLLWALDIETTREATPVVIDALHDPAWRVREKAAQVIARHVIDEGLEDVVVLRDDDPVARVRAAADRAVRRLTVG